METISKTIPIRFGSDLSLGIDEAQAYGRSLAPAYGSEGPFPHIAIDNFLPDNLLQFICRNFPVDPTDREKVFEKGYTGLHKRQISPYACSSDLTNLFLFFNSAPMLQFLESMTAIEGLIADPYFSGGGFHEIYSGGLLGIHSDFKINESLHLERRLNIIIYLNEDWRAEYGGNLELWDPEMTSCVKSIAPVSNRCVIFNTDRDSNHGHPDPLTTPEGISRRSIALYYYTASKQIYDEIEFAKTLYRARPGDSSKVKRLTRKREKRDKRKTLGARAADFFNGLFRQH
jgi:hypothetical protein